MTCTVTGSHLSAPRDKEKIQQKKSRKKDTIQCSASSWTLCNKKLHLPDRCQKTLLCYKLLNKYVLHSYLATWDYPVGDSQERQTYGDPQYCPALHSDRLLPQSGEILIPDRQQLLLTVGMCNKLEIIQKIYYRGSNKRRYNILSSCSLYVQF